MRIGIPILVVKNISPDSVRARVGLVHALYVPREVLEEVQYMLYKYS